MLFATFGCKVTAFFDICKVLGYLSDFLCRSCLGQDLLFYAIGKFLFVSAYLFYRSSLADTLFVV